MVLVENWLPPSRENWELVVTVWKYFPLVTAVQWITPFFPQGKTSIDSRFNVPGWLGWMLMELPGMSTVLYLMYSLPPTIGNGRTAWDLPWGNWTMAGMYTIHYLYRAVLSPVFLNPSMSPIHPFVMVSAAVWQLINGISIGGWLAGYGPTGVWDWTGRLTSINLGLLIWSFGFVGNIWHDDELREIRRAVARKQRQKEAEAKKSSGGAAGKVNVDKVYMLPKNGLFSVILFPHYVCEWIEWIGFWMVGGPACIPAQSFVLNEISTMVPRALTGKRWYIERFGKDKVGSRGAVIPYIL